MGNNWIDIHGYENLYRVSSNGEIYSIRSNKILKPFLRGRKPDGRYFVVDLNKFGDSKTVSIHRLVAEAFIPNSNNLPCVNHKDGNKYNNCVDNLEWCTYLDNNNHAIKTGLKKYKSGIQNKNSKLTYDDVVEIKKCLILGDSKYGTRPLAVKYGVDHNVIRDIYYNKKYQDVEIQYTYFVSSDIHSAYTIWMNALKNAGFNKNKYSHKVVVCGDLFDRMDETVQCFEFVQELQKQGRLIYIRGNHEDLLIDCVDEIRAGRVPSSHHFSNGTVKTICQFCGQNEWIIYDPTWRDKICEIMQPVLDFINKNCVDYVEIGDYILTHAWLPTYSHLDDFRDADKSDWEQARWLNGMEMWTNPKNRIEGKTVLVGHWHCSWGWSHIRQERKEWPQKNRKDWQKSFEPFVDDGIIAIDACCAYSGKINVVILEVNENE